MLMLFWDHQGSLVEHYMSKGTTVTSALYGNLIMNHLRTVVRAKHHGMLSTNVLLLHDTVRPHSAHVRAEMNRHIQFECLPHLMYLLTFTPYDYHIFGPLKADLGGTRLPDLMKKCRSQCTSGYKHSWRILFTRHLWSVLGYALNTTRAMLKNDTPVPNLSAPN
jgi:hypothetical protein